MKIGLLNTTLDVNENFLAEKNIEAFSTQGEGFEIGIFYRQPFWKTHRLLWFTELNFQDVTYQKSLSSQVDDIQFNHDTQFKFTNLQAKLGAAYEGNMNRIRPIVSAHGILSYNVSNQNKLFVATIDGNTIEFSDEGNELTWKTKLQYGLGLGIGAMMYYGNKGKALKIQGETDLLFNSKNEFRRLQQFRITLSTTIL